MKKEEATTDIEEVKAQIQDMAVKGDARWGGEGFLVVTPWLKGEAGHEWGLTHASQRNVLTLPWAEGALDSGYSPDAPLFSSPEVTYVTLRWPIPRVDCPANLEHGVRPGRSKLWASSLDEIWEYRLRPICGLQRAILLENNHRSLLPWVRKYVVRDVHAISTE